MKSNSRILVISFGLIAGFLLLVFGYGVFYIRNENSGTGVLLAKATELSGNDTRTQSIRTLRNNSKVDLEVLDTATLTPDKVVPLLELLEKTGKDMGLKTTVSSVSSDKNTNGALSPQTLHVSINTEGTWQGNLRFIHALENLPFKIVVDNSSLNVEEAGKAWKGAAEVTLYSFPE